MKYILEWRHNVLYTVTNPFETNINGVIHRTLCLFISKIVNGCTKLVNRLLLCSGKEEKDQHKSLGTTVTWTTGSSVICRYFGNGFSFLDNGQKKTILQSGSEKHSFQNNSFFVFAKDF